ncbi:hypothetical protein BV96_00436 [Sphingomonas paucimobilis]|uniref:hypothetical protein n=1 Tax=Sphingobium sp. DC-2 TaxID=1303256 RepID=UPI00044FAB44|nr:hypothetical protein [Sphingobium sp. DC-2]EZP74348.1 hypothetical protein BV96_00436 [Sphingomonas paucimobilis]
MIRKLALLAGAGFLAKKLFDRSREDKAASSPGHRPTDLSGDRHPDGSSRADEHFRPDPTATVSASDRESLRPVTMPAPHDPPGV